MSTLEDAIDRLYFAFSNVPAPHHIEGCPCCFESKQVSRLLGTPLRTITPTDLTRYASSAMLTVGDVSDYLHFLPRILEISARDDSWWPDIEVTADRIRSTGFQSRPAHRREALVYLTHAVLGDIIASRAYFRLDGWMCAIAILGLDVRPYLAEIEKTPAAVLQYFEDNAECLKKGELCNAFWELPNEGHDAIVRWFKSEPIRKIPFDAYGCVM